MRTHDITDTDGRVVAFEVSNFHLGRRSLGRFVSRIPGCVLVRGPRRFSFDDDQFCEFELDGVRFVAWEPFGDNSRFWVGPKVDEATTPQWCPQIDRIRDAFRAIRPFFGILFGEPAGGGNSAPPLQF
jgi:hypothetical protein